MNNTITIGNGFKALNRHGWVCLLQNCVPTKQHRMFKLQCITELYSKNVVNTFFLNQYRFPLGEHTACRELQAVIFLLILW